MGPVGLTPGGDMKWTQLLGELALILFLATLASAQQPTSSTIDKTAALANFQTGVALERKGDFSGAIGAYKEALSLDWELAQASSNLCAAYSKLSDYVLALEACERAVQLDRRSVTAQRNLGRVYELSG